MVDAGGEIVLPRGGQLEGGNTLSPCPGCTCKPAFNRGF